MKLMALHEYYTLSGVERTAALLQEDILEIFHFEIKQIFDYDCKKFVLIIFIWNDIDDAIPILKIVFECSVCVQMAMRKLIKR